MALHVDYAYARAPTPSTRPAPTATRGSSYTDPLALRFRVLLPCGYEDLNDHDTLRNDIAFQTAVEKDQVLGGRSTLCRFEQQADRALMWRLHEQLLEQFIDSFAAPPELNPRL